MLQPPKLTDQAICGGQVRVTVSLRVDFKGMEQTHKIYLTVEQRGGTWMITGMAANYDAKPEG